MLAASAKVTPIDAAPRQRLRYVDGLRACAALAVILDHAALTMPMWHTVPWSSAVPWYWLGHVLVDGGHGVDLFFVLSGFCLAYPSLEKWRTTGAASFNVTRFVVHRLVRILPPYYVATGLLLAIATIVALRTGNFHTPGDTAIGLRDVLGQIFLLDRGVTLASAPYWTRFCRVTVSE